MIVKEQLLLGAKKLHVDAVVPSKSNASDSGYDFFVMKDECWTRNEYLLAPGERKLFSTGISLELPDGYGMLLRDRSSVSVRDGLHVLAGVIDNGYRGEVKICLVNLSDIDYSLTEGQKIAQGILHPVPDCEVQEINELSETDRGEKGFGSSGK